MSNEPLITIPSATIGSDNYIATVLDNVKARLDTDVNSHTVGDTNYGKLFGKQSILSENNEYMGVINYNSNGERHGLLSLCDNSGKITREAQYENDELVSYDIVSEGSHYSWNKYETTYQYCVSDGVNELRYNVDSTNLGYGNALLNGKLVVLEGGKIKKSGSICSLMVMLIIVVVGIIMFIVSMF